MTLFHLSIRSAEPMRNDESSAKGFMVSIEIWRLTLELWVGI